ncbi:MAG: hypothetical protein KVP17_003373 [Porospora cf. gigantea B]|nr:MAG: hypothetical protein KVP17_003373 [Porospora cf. gigantea B]
MLRINPPSANQIPTLIASFPIQAFDSTMTPSSLKHRTPQRGILQQLNLPLTSMKSLAETVRSECELGLKRNSARQAGLNTNAESSLEMIDTCVLDNVTGRETGTFLAMDLGGSNFRVSVCGLDGSSIQTDHHQVAVPDWIMSKDTTGTAFFNFLAEEVDSIYPGPCNVGLTFSFPLEQAAKNHATLKYWTKGWQSGEDTNDPVVGEDVVGRLNEAFARRRSGNKVVVCVNDTVGAQQALTYELKNRTCDDSNCSEDVCDMALIIGTGFNISYTDRQARSQFNYKGDIVNTEMAALKPRIPISTAVDNAIDREEAPGVHSFEKMIAGKKAGKTASQVYPQICKDRGLRVEVLSKELSASQTAALANAFTLDKDSISAVEAVGLSLPEPQADALCAASYAVFHRSAQMVASCIKGCYDRIGKHSLTVGVDGSMYVKNTFYQEMVKNALEQLVGPGRVTMMISSDGSGRGAAVTAAANGCE